MIRRSLCGMTLASLLTWGSSIFANAPSQEPSPLTASIGVVNFSECVEKSKLGVQEQKSLEEARKQMFSSLESMKRELEEMAGKFQDPEYLDSISSEEESKMREKFAKLSSDLSNYENQYLQILNQAKMQFVHKLASYVGRASEKIAQERGLSLVVDNDVCFFYGSKLNLTQDVLAQMDQEFDLQEKTSETPNPSEKEPTS